MLTQDPIGLAGGVNLYAYAVNNPIAFDDPYGLCPVCAAAYALFEIGSSAYDAYDLAKTGVAYLRGKASKTELAVTAAGALTGVVSVGGGYGKAGRIGLSTVESWGRAGTLADHFARHGADFGARNADEYASLASDFLQQSQKSGALTKIDKNGVIRVYDPKTNTFAAYNADGTTKTFYKPDPSQHGYQTNMDYWNAQQGSPP